ncbi:MAG: transporter [Ramlibacter sp.]|nr:transporter [Ramlibacter sp.]
MRGNAGKRLAKVKVIKNYIHDESFFGAGRVYLGWMTVIAGAVALTFGPSTMTAISFGLFVPALNKEFGWGIPAISFAATIMNVTIVIASILQGYLVDRFGARRVIVLSIPVFGASLASVSLLSDNIVLLYLAYALVPLCAVGLWPASYLKATSSWFHRRLGFALGLTNAGIGIGAALLPIIITYVITNYGWRNAYVLLGTLAIVVTWPIALFWLQERNAPDNAGAMDQQNATAGQAMNLRDAANTSTFWRSMGAFALLGIMNGGIAVHLVSILIAEGLTPQTAGLLMSALGVSLVVGRIGTGWLLDRLTAASIMTVIVLGSAAACAVLAMGAGANLGVATACACVFGLVLGAEFDVLSYVIPRYWGRQAFGRIFGVVFAVFQFGAGLGAIGLGYSRGYFGTYAPALWALATLLVISALLFSQLGAYRFGGREPIPEPMVPATA